MSTREQHWNDVYSRKAETEVSWYEPEPALSLELIARCGTPLDGKIIDVGGGASLLVDALLDRGFRDVTVLDISSAALAKTRERLGPRGEAVHWIAADVTAFEPPAPFALWHDRAVFHFLTSPADRAAYASALARGVAPGGHAVVGTFALDGPERCSGLEIVRYDAPGLASALGPAFELVEQLRHEHTTPGGKVQAFTFVRLLRR